VSARFPRIIAALFAAALAMPASTADPTRTLRIAFPVAASGFDPLYERSRALPNGPEHTALFLKLTQIVLNDAPWKLGLNPYANVLAQPWLKGYKQQPLFRHQWKCYDVGARS